VTDESSTQPEKPKKSWVGKLLAVVGAIGTLIVAPIIVNRVSSHLSPPPNPPPPIIVPAPPRPAPPMPIADPLIVNTVPQSDAPITVTFNHGAQCNHVFPAPNVAVDGDTTKIVLNVAGKTETPVALTGMHVSVTKRSQPTGNSQFCAGIPESVSVFAVDLDQSPPPVVAQPGRDKNNAAAAPLDFPIDVSLSDRETIVVIASTRNYDCTWAIGLDWTANGQSGTWLVDDHGAPFRTMSTGKTG
jgi:hypothetical protein